MVLINSKQRIAVTPQGRCASADEESQEAEAATDGLRPKRRAIVCLKSGVLQLQPKTDDPNKELQYDPNHRSNRNLDLEVSKATDPVSGLALRFGLMVALLSLFVTQ